MVRRRIRTWVAVFMWAAAYRAEALVYCVTNAVDQHLSEPTGVWTNSGWRESVPLGNFMGTVFHTNAMLTAKHLYFSAGVTFSYEGQTRTVTAASNDPDSDLTVLFFSPAATNAARLNIETNDVFSTVVLQGRGRERGAPVVVGGKTNGWQWGATMRRRRWGVNRYEGATPDADALAIASFDNTDDPDECMLSVGDSGGPGFVRTGSGWKLATINYSVYPASFSFSTNPVSSFYASMTDCAGLYYDNEAGGWDYVPPEESPSPCMMVNTRTAVHLAWITNVVPDLAFPADLGLAWRCATNAPPAAVAATGVWFEVAISNAGPYTARGVAVDFAWPVGVRPFRYAPSCGAVSSNRWTLSELEDGGAATLRVDTVVRRLAAAWATNRATIVASDKPDEAPANDAAELPLLLPATATLLMVQ